MASPNIPNIPPVNQAVGQVVASSGSFFKSPGGILSIVMIVIGSILAGVAQTASDGNETVKQNYIGGGSAFIIIGVAVALYASGGFATMVEFSKKTEGGSFFSLFLVIVVTISIFVALFYSYSPPDVIPFASVVLIILAVLGTVGVLYVFSGKQQIANVITRFAFSLFYFMPYTVFSYGIISDIITRSIQYTPASFTGLTGVLLNFAISAFMSPGGVAPQVSNPLCEIPGMSQLSSSFVPQPMMFTLSTIAYIATYISRSNIGGISGYVVNADYRWPAWALYFGVYGLQLVVLSAQGCMNPTKAIGGLLAPLGWGGIMGLIGFSVLERGGSPPVPVVPGLPVIPATVSMKCPDGSNSFAGKCPAVDGKCPNGRTPVAGMCSLYESSSAPTCSAGSGDGEFVCESFKNGKLETSVMTE